MSASKPVWKNQVERDAFVEKHCDKCFQPDQARKRVLGLGDGCPVLARADQNKLPKAFTLRRNATLGDKYECLTEMTKPGTTARKTSKADTESMFDDLEPQDYTLVPLPEELNWPDRPRAKQKEGDHQ